MSAKSKNEKSIFKAALELKTATERIAYVDKVCADDPVLKARILALLEAHEDKGDFLEGLLDDSAVSLDGQKMKEKPGTVIGRYKLLEKIGEGGMAVVYMAEQEKPIRRKVALKIIKLGMDTKSVIARFEAERQALAMMEHPNIAKVFDAGATESGRPYFVMELVEGASITTYCDENRLGTKERLGLFIQVCNAVQHAHQKGIIHRDLKPSNVLITLQDGLPTPKVIDFGIAKATNQRLTEKTLFTRYAQMIGTPAYMSPEQAELSDLEIDTRTDIYSLGILLYELLTGTPPFSEEELRKAGYIEMQRIICQEEPDKPSTKLTTLGEKLTDIAKHRGSAPDVLTKAVRGDLDWIVMKSIEKDRSRRYETADGFAGDIQRHLNDEPVLARPPELVYRLRKFVRRHRLQAAAVLMLVLLAVAIVISLSIWNRYRHQVKESESFTHRQTLAWARKSLLERDFSTAIKEAESILDSRHIGPEAQLLYASILIESNEPNDAVVRLKNLLDERPQIAGAARALLDRVNLEVELVEAERPAKIILPVGKTIFVDANAAGTNDGSSWDNAYKYLQDALAAASRGDVIKVAGGVYKPDQGAAVTPGDREAAFRLKNGVAVYGGIVGGQSILSGDLNSDDGPDFAGNDENSYHVVRAGQTDETAVLDGFTITAGNANGKIFSAQARGGGMSCRPGSPTVTNCTFRGNAAQHGGGMFNEFNAKPIVTNCTFTGNKSYFDGAGVFNHTHSSPTFINCTFTGNTAQTWGGGMRNQDSSPTVKNCSFTGNSAQKEGGGMGSHGSSLNLTKCRFENNSTAEHGGGMCNGGSTGVVTDCIFTGNSAEEGGGMFNISKSNPKVTNCTFTENKVHNQGGGMYNQDSSPTLTNCKFENNLAANNGGGVCNAGCTSVVTECIFSGNTAQKNGGGMFNVSNGNPKLTNCTFTGNSARNEGGGMRNQDSSPIVTNCFFTSNSAEEGGGGMWNGGDRCTPVVTDCTFNDNTAGKVGGGMNNTNNSSPTLENCTFTGNSAEEGGGVLNFYHGSPIVTNCIFTSNSAKKLGGGIWNGGCNPVVKDCIFRGNTANHAGGGMHNTGDGNPIVSNCIFTGNSAQDIGGGMHNFWDNNTTVTNCTFNGNSAQQGGGMHIHTRSNTIITNCSFTGNTAYVVGGGVYNFRKASSTVTNCTFSGNSAKKGGAVAHWNNSSSKLSNCIIWGNTADNGPQIALDENSSVTVNYCDIQGGLPEINVDDPNSSVTWGVGNIEANPLFVNAANADYYLRAGSPCIDTGDNSVLPASVDVDLDGNPRVINGTVDMGAYEYSRLLSTHMRAGNPSPADGATDVTQTAILQWSAGAEAHKHDLYFGTDEVAVRSASMRSPEYKGTKGLGSESYSSTELKSGTTYYWRVDEYNTDAMVSKGRVWSFTVADETVEQTAPNREGGGT